MTPPEPTRAAVLQELAPDAGPARASLRSAPPPPDSLPTCRRRRGSAWSASNMNFVPLPAIGCARTSSLFCGGPAEGRMVIGMHLPDGRLAERRRSEVPPPARGIRRPS